MFAKRKCAHNPASELFLGATPLNVTFIGTTQAIHEKNLKSTKGLNKLYITDENGNVTKTQFSVI